MKKYDELDTLGKKARDNERILDCSKCPRYRKCDELTMEACDYVYLTAFRKGYILRKKETEQ